MGNAEAKELLEDEETKVVKQIALEHGPEALSKYLEKQIDRWKNEKVTFAVTGRSATGKSTFINKIRDVKPREEGYAKSGGGNTTKEPTPYVNPQNPHVVFYDLPGVGTLEFPKDKYASKMNLKKYDYFFIFFDKVVSEDDYFLITELLNLKKSFCLVRSKIDDDIRNAEEDEKNVEEVIPAIRKEIREQVSRYEQLKNSDAIFLISARKKELGDWEELLCHVEKSLSHSKFETFMFSLPTLTEKVIDIKYQTLQSRIKFVAATSGAMAAIPIPGVDLVANLGVLAVEVKHYIEVFGLGKDTLDTLEGFDRTQLKCVSYVNPERQLPEVLLSNLGKYAGLLAIGSVTDIVLPIIGSFISAGTSAILSYKFLSQTLDNFRDDASIVYRFVMEKQKV